MKALERLQLSERVIDGWEAMGKPGGPLRDNMRLIGQELEALRKVASDSPELQARVDVVAERYGRMALKLKLGLN